MSEPSFIIPADSKCRICGKPLGKPFEGSGPTIALVLVVDCYDNWKDGIGVWDWTDEMYAHQVCFETAKVSRS